MKSLSRFARLRTSHTFYSHSLLLTCLSQLFSEAMGDAEGGNMAEPLLEMGRLRFKRATSARELEVAKERLERCIKVASMEEDEMDNSDSEEDDYNSAVQEASIYLARLICQSPQHVEQARRHLSSLGYKYRLSPQVLLPSLSSSSNTPPTSPSTTPPFVCVFDEALPVPLLSRLQEAFNPTSPFWGEHGYGSPTTGYFSYQLKVSGSMSQVDELRKT